jgi:DNA mismatch repair protein MutL
MSDVIKLLPDHVINQIAAGEVIQRPASAVKELLENAIDAGSTKIRLIIKEAGKTLIQVIDNGSGMSETDARLSFEKHATSKINNVDDIFAIKTKGFRGEALASIAAIATVELKTRQANSTFGNLIEVENGVVKKQEPCQCEPGSSFTIKNLFFNVPARKNFLKSDPVELRHIIEEFQRVALPHPEIEFYFFNNTEELFHLPKGNLKQRIVALYNNSYNEKLVPIEERTTILNISGFIGKPEFAKKTRGEQFFFVNNRFIKNNYLNHAVQSTYAELIAKDVFPSYFIFLETPPNKIDINIHPTKTEIKFEDEPSIYAILKATVKKSLGQYNVAPPMDFNQEMSFEISPIKKDTIIRAPEIKLNPNYNPFKEEEKKSAPIKTSWEKPSKSSIAATHETLKQIREAPVIEPGFIEHKEQSIKWTENWDEQYIVALKEGKLLLVDQQLAWERIFFEEAQTALEKQQNAPTQKELFPQTLQFPAEDFSILQELQPDLRFLGFDISEFGKQTAIVYGIPPGTESSSVEDIIHEMIEYYKQGKEMKKPRVEVLARAYARKMAGRKAKVLKEEERLQLLEQLFMCHIADIALDGKRIFIEISLADVAAMLKPGR